MTNPGTTIDKPAAGAAGPLLSLRGVNKSFGAVHVLQEVDFDVYPGQVTALVGDNGAGKSTLIKGIAGIYGFDSGDYLFEAAATGHTARVVFEPVSQGRKVLRTKAFAQRAGARSKP